VDAILDDLAFGYLVEREAGAGAHEVAGQGDRVMCVCAVGELTSEHGGPELRDLGSVVGVDADADNGGSRHDRLPVRGEVSDRGVRWRFGRRLRPDLCRERGSRFVDGAVFTDHDGQGGQRFHKTMRAEWATPTARTFVTIVEAQASLDAWVREYNTVRPHQSVGGRPPIARFALAGPRPTSVELDERSEEVESRRRPSRTRAPGVSRWVDHPGQIRLAGFAYSVGPVFAGEHVEVVAGEGIVSILHHGVLVASHAQRLRADQLDRLQRPERAPLVRRARDATAGLTVTRIADGDGVISFAATPYRAGRAWARQNIDVTIVAGSVQLSVDGKVIRVHPIRHERSRELAFANPKGRPRHVKQA
jgi:Integrase core domain